MSNPEILRGAVALAESGIHVCASYGIVEQDGERFCACVRGPNCIEPGKHPFGKGWQNSGVRDPAKVRERFKIAFGHNDRPMNVSILTGQRYGLLVLDVDGQEGIAALNKLTAEHGELPETPTAATGGGGLHYFFEAVEEPIRNSARRLGPNLDIRGEGGQVIAAPSRHLSGGAYHWLPDAAPWEVVPAPFPDWLRQLCLSKASRRSRGGSHRRSSSEPSAADGWTYPEGTRNDSLFTVGSKLRKQGLGREEIGALLDAANAKRCRPPLEPAEVDKILDSVMRYEPGSPIRPTHRDRHHARRAMAPEPAPAEQPAPEDQPGENGQRVIIAELEQVRSRFELELEQIQAEDAAPADDFEILEPPLDDNGNADRFVALHGRDLAYTPTWKKWLCWDGRRWRIDELGEPFYRAQQTGELLRETVFDQIEPNPKERSEREKKLASFATSSNNNSKVKAMLSFAQARPEIARAPDHWDRDPWRLVAENGTVCLKTGRIEPHIRADAITKLAATTYEPHASCPRWLAFLDQIFQGDADLIGFTQRAVGYSLVGTPAEEVLFFCHGDGGNGKSVFYGTLLRLLGDYGIPAAPELLDATEQHPAGMADLRGARFVVAPETEEGANWSEKRAKLLASRDRIKARFMNENYFHFDPTHTLWISGNHKPRIRGKDDGIWRRIRLIPFDVTIPKSERDPELEDKLRAEWPGILAWAVRGCLAWQRDGLGSPDRVEAATAEYREEQDPVGRFLRLCTIKLQGAEVRSSKLFEAFKEWASESGERRVSSVRFAKALERAGFEKRRSNGVRWIGLGLKSDDPAELEADELGAY